VLSSRMPRHAASRAKFIDISQAAAGNDPE
jgi:hypothetical protein